MPHKCVRCGTVFENTSLELVKGCACGSRVFVYLKNEAAELPRTPNPPANLAWLEDELSYLARDHPVSVDADAVENLTVVEEGAYHLDISSLAKGNPLVVKSEKGVYYIRMPPFSGKQKRG